MLRVVAQRYNDSSSPRPSAMMFIVMVSQY